MTMMINRIIFLKTIISYFTVSYCTSECSTHDLTYTGLLSVQMLTVHRGTTLYVLVTG